MNDYDFGPLMIVVLFELRPRKGISWAQERELRIALYELISRRF